MLSHLAFTSRSLRHFWLYFVLLFGAATVAAAQGAPAGFVEQGRLSLELMVRREGEKKLRPLVAVDRLRRGDSLVVTGPSYVIRGSDQDGQGWQLVVGFCAGESGRVAMDAGWKSVLLKPSNYTTPQEFPVLSDEYCYPVVFLVADHERAPYEMLRKQARESDHFFNSARRLAALCQEEARISGLERFLTAFEASPEAKAGNWKQRVELMMQDLGFRVPEAGLAQLQQPGQVRELTMDLRKYLSERQDFRVETLAPVGKALLGPQLSEVAGLFVSAVQLVKQLLPADPTYKIQPAVLSPDPEKPGKVTLLLTAPVEKDKKERSIVMAVPFFPGREERAPEIRVPADAVDALVRGDQSLVLPSRGTGPSLANGKLDRQWILSLHDAAGMELHPNATIARLADTGSFVVVESAAVWELFGKSTELFGRLRGRWCWDPIETNSFRLLRVASGGSWSLRNSRHDLVSGRKVDLQLQTGEPARLQQVSFGPSPDKAQVLARDLSTDPTGAATVPLDLSAVPAGELTLFVQPVGAEAPLPIKLQVLPKEPQVTVRLQAGGRTLLVEGERLALVRAVEVEGLHFEPDLAERALRRELGPGPTPRGAGEAERRRFRVVGRNTIPEQWLQAPPPARVTLADPVEPPRVIPPVKVEVTPSPQAVAGAELVQRDRRFLYDLAGDKIVATTARIELTLSGSGGYRFPAKMVLEIGTGVDESDIQDRITLDAAAGLEVRGNRVRMDLALGEMLGPRASGPVFFRIRDSAEPNAAVGEWQDAGFALVRFPDLQKVEDAGERTVVLRGKDLRRVESVSSDGTSFVRPTRETATTDGVERLRIPRTDGARFWITLEDSPGVKVRVMLPVEPAVSP